MLHQKMIGWTVPKCRDADQPKQLQLNHLAQRITHVEVGELSGFRLRMLHLFKQKSMHLKKLYLRTVCIKGYDTEQRT